MSLHTVDIESGSPVLIPATIQDLEADLANPKQRVYVFVGKDADVGWECAVLSCGTLAGVKPYLADTIDELRKWVPTGEPKGIVFGTGNTPQTLLSEAEASVQGTVEHAIAHAA